MEPCKHELKDLVGRADGIHCRACGMIFKSIPKAGEAGEDEKAAAAPVKLKKGGRNARK